MISRIATYSLSFVLVGMGIWSFRLWSAERTLQADPSIAGYTEALRWNPDSDQLRASLGAAYRDQVEGADPGSAVRELKKAAELAPRIWTHHLNLALAHELAGERAAAQVSFDRALSLNPRHAQLRWHTANFHLRQGRLKEAMAEFKAGVDFDPSRLLPAADRLHAAGSTLEEMAQNVVPAGRQHLSDYLGFVLKHVDAQPESADRIAWDLWQRWEQARPGLKVKNSNLYRYIDHLLRRGELDKARRVWGVVSQVGGDGLVFNGGFERATLNGGLDWVLPKHQEAYWEYDHRTRFEGGASLRIDFSGRSNLDYRGPRQTVILPAGKLELSFVAKSEAVSTDQGITLDLCTYPGNELIARSESIKGTQPWKRMTHEFKLDSPTAAYLILRRQPSRKFDNLLGGTLWVDEIGIRHSRSAEVFRASFPKPQAPSRSRSDGEPVERKMAGWVMLSSEKAKISGHAAYEGTTLFHGDEVTTDQGTALLALSDGGRLLISAKSRIRLDAAADRIGMTVLEGDALDATDPRVGAADRRIVETAKTRMIRQRGKIVGKWHWNERR